MAEVRINPDNEILNHKIEVKPVPEKNIGIDTDHTFENDIAEGVLSSTLDTSQIDKFTTLSQDRDILYAQIDNMCQDSILSAVLEDYAQDSTEYNTSGHVMWAESNDTEVANFVNFLLDSANVDKNIDKWAYSLCKYGDVYLRLVHESEYKKDIFGNEKNERSILEESAKLIAYTPNDKYAYHLEMQTNPAEVFELTQFDKTSGYIKTHVSPTAGADGNGANTSGWYDPTKTNSFLNLYRFNLNKDVELFAATEFVHGSLQGGTSRYQEKVDLYTLDDDNETLNYSYSVKKGQSALYDIYQTWRELRLLENSIQLARLTQSALTRVVEVELGDTAREVVPEKMKSVKRMIEQKSAIDTNYSFGEYTNPGPIINTIYVPTKDGKGHISTSTIGGDFDPKNLTDIEYFRDKLFGGLRVPKQLYGYTGDSAGFDAGKSIAEMSSKYAKFIKKVQNVLVQMVTDWVNIILLDRGLNSYVNNFTLKMTPPASSEETNRANILESKIGNISSIMNVIDIEEEAPKLKILKALLSNVIENQDVIDVIQERIESLEEEGNSEFEEEEEFGEEEFGGGSSRMPRPEGGSSASSAIADMGIDIPEPEEEGGGEEELPTPEEVGVTAEESFLDTEGEPLVEDNFLPSPSDLGIDFVRYTKR